MSNSFDDSLLELRNLTYHRFVDLGHSPTPEEIADVWGGRTVDDVRAGWRSLHEVHALVLDFATYELRMVNPFAARPTAYRVDAAGRSWFANCAWDAVGICAALHADGRIETECAGCGQRLAVTIESGAPVEPGAMVFHVSVPASNWWDDIGFT